MIEQLFSGSSYASVKQMLDLTLQRQEALAGNIANAETPGYRRMDLDRAGVADFQKQLHTAAHTGDFSQASAQPLATPRITADPTAQSQRQDGNNVEVDNELLAMSRNTMEYNVLTDFASNSLKCLKMAIVGHDV